MVLKNIQLLILSFLKSKYATYFLCSLAFIEAIFFPIPPDLLLIPLAIINHKKVFLLAFLTTFFSVLGGCIGYLIGNLFFDQIGIQILNWLDLTKQFSIFSTSYNKNGILAVLLGGFSPVPYKLIAIISGTTSLPFYDFLWASFISRGLRFFLLAFLIYFFRNTSKQIINKYFIAVVTIITVIFLLIIIGFYLK
ncbi:MAG: YqaA family protein [Paracoccaceae bacterium]